jgi:hypothetical protein
MNGRNNKERSMKYRIHAGKVALALALLCSACSKGSSSPQSSGGSNNPGKCDSATNVTPCGGDLVGSWDVTSSCLKLSGDFTSRGTGLGCDTFKVTGAAQVSGSFVMTADKKFQDNTTTTGDVTVTLEKNCLFMSGSWTSCDLISIAIEGLGYTDVHCVNGTAGGCNCPGKINQKGTMGLIVSTPEVKGTYTTKDNTFTSDDPNPLTGADLVYSYCVDNGTMTVTPKTTSPTTTGSIVLKKGNTPYGWHWRRWHWRWGKHWHGWQHQLGWRLCRGGQH